MMIECIKEGFHLANRNYQLVFLRIIVVIINFLSLLFFLGLPIIAAVAYMGFDLSHAVDLLPDLMENPFNLLSKYLGLVFLIGISFIFYLTFVSTIILYSLGGTLGVLRNSAVNVQYRFSLSSFFKEANSIFSRLFWLVSILSLIFLVLFIVIILSGGVAAGFMQGFSWAETTLEVFLGSFVFLSTIIFGIIILFSWLIFTVYSLLCLVIEGKGSADTIKNTFNHLKKTPQAFLFFIILFGGAIAINLVFFLIMIPLGMLPLVDIALYLVSVVFQNYLAIVVWSALTVYYTKTANYPLNTTMYDI
jgi:hypothetical protein